MDEVTNSMTKFVSNFIDVSAPYVIAAGLIVGVSSLLIVGIKLIHARNGQDRAIVLNNFTWSLIGLGLLGIFISIFYYLISTFF